MKTQWTLDEWLEGRLRRRQIADSISPAECGRETSRDDAVLRTAFRGKRNRPFATTRELAALSEAARQRLARRAAGMHSDAVRQSGDPQA